MGAHPHRDRRVSAEAPRVGCGAAIVRDGRLLLVKRLRPPEAGHWNLVGGKVDFLETIEDAVRRETREEVGLEIALGDPLPLVQMIGLDGQHWVSAVYCAHVVSGEAILREPDKMSHLTWAALDDPPEPLALAARLAIAALKADG